ncbi:MAG: YhdH/YhfP family quinone oxidoreductase [Bacteroidales bacterium]
MQMFKAFRTVEENGVFTSSVQQIPFASLPTNEVLVKVHYSGINYKDLLSSKGNKGVTKVYPHTPGIDAAGVVVSDSTGKFIAGDEVVVMGYDLGMNTDGGFAEYISVPAAWVLLKPSRFTLRETMLIGTSGFTAALGISKMLRNGQAPSDGPVVVTGATGGVGSFAVQILSKLGFDVYCVTGKPEMKDALVALGAKDIILRSDFMVLPEKPLVRPKYAGGLDTVGGEMLVSLLKQCFKSGSVATCGNVGGADLKMTVLPFILNGINLLGINAADTPMAVRKQVWDLLCNSVEPDQVAKLGTEISLQEVGVALDKISQGKHTGRFLIQLL